MPAKDPTFLTIILNYFNNHAYSVQGGAMAFIIALARSFMFKESNFFGALLDAFLCALLTLSLESLLSYMGLGLQLSIFMGALVGFLGATKVREVFNAIVTSRVKQISKKDED